MLTKSDYCRQFKAPGVTQGAGFSCIKSAPFERGWTESSDAIRIVDVAKAAIDDSAVDVTDINRLFFVFYERFRQVFTNIADNRPSNIAITNVVYSFADRDSYVAIVIAPAFDGKNMTGYSSIS